MQGPNKNSNPDYSHPYYECIPQATPDFGTPPCEVAPSLAPRELCDRGFQNYGILSSGAGNRNIPICSMHT